MKDIAAECDVLVENFVPGTMANFGLSYDDLQKVNPRLVYCSISGFGQTGPYAQRPALDIIVQAMGGIMSITGEPNGGPVRPGSSLGDMIAGLFATTAILAAVQERERSGEGQYIDVSMLECQLAILEAAVGRYVSTGHVPGPIGTRHPFVHAVPGVQDGGRLDCRGDCRRRERPVAAVLCRHRPCGPD